jgi:hypothetical protein
MTADSHATFISVSFIKSIIQDLKKNFEIVKLVTGSLLACHRLAAAVAGPGGLTGLTLVDGRYTYREVSLTVFVFCGFRDWLNFFYLNCKTNICWVQL